MSFTYYLETDVDVSVESVLKVLVGLLGGESADSQLRVNDLLIHVRVANTTDAEGTQESFGFTPTLIVSFRHLPLTDPEMSQAYELMLRSIGLLLNLNPKSHFFRDFSKVGAVVRPFVSHKMNS